MEPEQPIDPDRWVNEHGDALYGYAMLRLRDPDAAAEVVQETFLEALRGQARFEGRSSERTWLISILKHKVIDHFRRRSRIEQWSDQGELADFDSSEFFDQRGAWKVPFGRWGELPEAEVERAEFWEVFRACLAELPPSYAEAFTLSELEGLAGPEICKLLEITPTNLWARLHRARMLLRRSLDARWFGREPGKT
jgi:RNA polymerase sigma-70 factor (TIGR02943 family)